MSAFQRRFAYVVIVVAIFASLSCAFGPSGGSNPAPTAAPATSAPLATIPPQAATALQPTPTAEPPVAHATAGPTQAAASGGEKLSSVNSNVDQLSSYRMAFTLSGSGKDENGSPVKQDMAFGQEVVKAKNSLHFSINGLGSLEASMAALGESLDIYQLDKQTYLYTPKQGDKTASCMSFGSEDAAFSDSLLKPGDMMKDIQTDQLIGKGEMLNGVKTDHFTVKKSVLGFGTATNESGEVWIAQDGGYVVKFAGQAEGSFDFTNKFTGNMAWSYEMKDVNVDFTIDLPQECAEQQNLTDIPMPENATKVGNLGTITTFGSPDAPDVVAKFYRDNLAGTGWTLKDENALGDIVTLTIEKDGKSMTVMITPDDDTKGSSVIITPAQ